MADQNSNILGNASDFSILSERLVAKNSNKQTEKLNKSIDNLNKNILAFAKAILPNSNIGRNVADISMSRRTFPTFREQMRSKVFGSGQSMFGQKFGSLRGALDTFGIVSKGSGGMFDELLEKREVKQQFIKDQLKVNPQMVDTPQNRKIFGNKFETQQKIQKQLNEIQREITRLQEQGFTEKQIKRSGLFKERDDQAAKLVASDNRLYGQIKDEMNEEIKAGIIEGMIEAAREADENLKRTGNIYGDKPEKFNHADPFGKRKESRDFAGTNNEDTEKMNEQDRLQEKILQAQNELVDQVKIIVEALEKEPEEQVVEKKESVFGGWLKTILGTIGTFLLAKMTGIVGMLTSGISSVLSPILKFLGVGAIGSGVAKKAGDVVGGLSKSATGETIKKGAESALDKVKSLAKSVAPKAISAAKFAGGLLLTKPALIAGATVGAAYLGYNALSDTNKEKVDNAIAKIFGEEKKEETKLTKNIKDEQAKIAKATTDKVEKIITEKSEQVEKVKAVQPTEPATIINAPVTNNNSNSVVNNIMSNPRNPEPTFNSYLRNRYSI